MLLVRVQSFLNGNLVAEHLYFGDNQVTALERFRRAYPEHEKCILVAQTIDGGNPDYDEYINVCWRCGMIG